MQINAIRRVQIDATTRGVDEATAKLNKLAGAQDNLAVVSDKSTKAQLSMERALERMQRQYDQAYRAQQALAKVERDLAGARAQGLVSQQRASELMQLAIRHHNSGAQAAMAHGRAMQLLQSQAMALTGSLGAAGTALGGLGPAGLAVGAGLAGVVLGLKQAADASLQLAESAGRLQDFAETTGFTVTQLQALEHAGAKVGVSSQSMTTALERFSVAMDDVKQATGPVYQTLQQIDPVLAGQIARTSSLSDAWDLFAEAVRKAGLEQRNALARQTFGRGGIEVTRLLGATVDAGGMSGLMAQMRQVDQITAEQAKRWDELGDSISRNLQIARQNIVSTFAGQTLTALHEFSAGLAQLSRLIKEGAPSASESDGWLAWANSWIDKIGRMLPLNAAVIAAFEKIRSMGAVSVSTQGGNPLLPSLDPGLDVAAADKFGRDEIIRQANALKEYTQRLGEAATPAEQLRVKIAQLNAEIAGNPGNIQVAEAARRQIAILNQSFNVERMRAGVSALGEAATVTQQYQMRLAELNLQLAKGEISQETFNQSVRGLDQERHLQGLRASVGALGSAATETERYALRLAELQQQLASGQISQEAFNRAIANLNPSIRETRRFAEDFAQDFASGILKGKSAVDSLNDALGSLSNALLNSGINDLFTGNFVSGGIKIAGAFLADFFSDQDEAATQAEASAMQAKQAWAAMARQVQSFTATLEGIEQSQLSSQVLQMHEQVSGFIMAAFNAGDWAGYEKLFADWAKFLERTINEFASGTPEMGEYAQAMADANDEAQAFKMVMLEVGFTIEEASTVAAQGLARMQAEILAQADAEFRSEMHELSGFGWINEITDALAKFADGTVAGVDPALLNAWLALTAQKVVDSAQLTGAAFQDLIARFPMLTGLVHEYSTALDESARAANEAAAAQQKSNLQIRLLQATTDTSTLGGALALFDARAALELSQAQADAIANPLLAANLPLLEAAIAAERTNIILDFANQAVETEQRAADERKRILEEAENFIAGITRRITEYIAGLLGGSQSPLSPLARLNQAQSDFNSQLALAQGGDRDALNSITGFHQTLIEAARAYYGSSAPFQALFNTSVGQLEALPSQVSPEELIVEAIEQQTVDVNAATLAMQTALTTVLNTGDLDAIRVSLAQFLPEIDTNTDNGISFAEMQSALGGTYATGTLRGIFNELDGNGNGILEKSELIRTNTGTTVTNTGETTTAVEAIQTLQNTANSLLSAANSWNSQHSTLLDAIRFWGEALWNLNNTATAHLNLMQTQMTSAPIFGSTLGATQNNMLTALNKIVYNTAAIANNTHNPNNLAGHHFGLLAQGGWITGGIPGRDSVMLASGGHIGMPGEFVVRKDIAQRDATWLPAYNATGRLPVANDNVAGEIRALRAELIGGIRQLVRAEIEAAKHVREGVDQGNSLQADSNKRLRRAG